MSVEVAETRLVGTLRRMLVAPRVLGEAFVPYHLVEGSLVASTLPPICHTTDLVSPTQVVFQVATLSPIKRDVGALSVLR